ncbi:hypothetical protein [Psychrosphaera algicola]|uniref:PEP-CTERM sorting domain-containing protein n=1 Tax=Psychrosphaera algicola TaxID=3023714 RepID=A0ABT5FE27_9GAMM|nr:hypothetical protein [Psychrosphaera sp. G1-22]MDC2889314.1 hypothetical protein [Psychrosphaera sp. G1-22]
MKTLISLKNSMKTCLVSLFLILSTSAQAGIIYEISSTDIKVGDDFTIDVVFDNATQQTLEGFAFDINDEALQTVDYLGDSLFNLDFMSFYGGADIDQFVVSFDPINSAQVTLATLNFTAHTAGSDTLTLLGNDGMFTGIFLANFGYESVDSSVTFSVTDVPEPSAFAFLICSLVLLVGKRRASSK